MQFCEASIILFISLLYNFVSVDPRRRNVTTAMVGLKMVTYAKISPKMVNSRDIVREYRRRSICCWVWMRYVAEPGIRRGNKDSRGNENRKSRKNIFSVEKNRQAYFL